jgi:hypothetical protein
MLTPIRALSVGLVVLACSDPSGPADDLTVRTVVQPAVFQAGNQVTVTVVVTNLGDVPHTIPASACPKPFDIETQQGVVVGPGEQICDAILITRTLAPGEEFSQQQVWIGDGIRGGIDRPTALLPAGSYLVRGSALPPGPRNPPASVIITN